MFSSSDKNCWVRKFATMVFGSHRTFKWLHIHQPIHKIDQCNLKSFSVVTILKPWEPKRSWVFLVRLPVENRYSKRHERLCEVYNAFPVEHENNCFNRLIFSFFFFLFRRENALNYKTLKISTVFFWPITWIYLWIKTLSIFTFCLKFDVV